MRSESVHKQRLITILSPMDRALSLRVFGIDLTQSSKQIQKNKCTRKADSTSDVREMIALQEEGQIKIEDNAKASDRASPTGLEDA